MRACKDEALLFHRVLFIFLLTLIKNSIFLSTGEAEGAGEFCCSAASSKNAVGMRENERKEEMGESICIKVTPNRSKMGLDNEWNRWCLGGKKDWATRDGEWGRTLTTTES